MVSGESDRRKCIQTGLGVLVEDGSVGEEEDERKEKQRAAEVQMVE